MFDLKSLLQKSIKRAGIKRQVDAYYILRAFDKLAGNILDENLKDSVKAISVRNKTLSVACLSSIVAQELKFKEKEIIECINDKFGVETINKIKYIV